MADNQLFSLCLPIFAADQQQVANGNLHVMKIANKSNNPYWRLIAVASALVGMLCLSACQSLPPEQAFAKTYGANLQYVSGAPWQHAVYVNPAAFMIQTERQRDKFLHVYIEGDGNAFVNGMVSVIQTPYNPFLLALMKKYQQPAIYVGRP